MTENNCKQTRKVLYLTENTVNKQMKILHMKKKRPKQQLLTNYCKLQEITVSNKFHNVNKK